MSKYRKTSGIDPFEPGSLEEADNAIFSGGLAPNLTPSSVRIKEIPLSEIWADVRQPRRAIPASIRLHWNGDPDEVRELLNQWSIIVKKLAPDLSLDERHIITGSGEGLDLEGAPPMVETYVSLLRLAQDIYTVGLTNPVSIVKQGNRYLIESGERRYLAHHLLAIWTAEDQYTKVPAVVNDGKDFVWRQASENTARRSLNAIGMARQIALLVMDIRSQKYNQTFHAFEQMVKEGASDRRFYAQVADGNRYEIPRDWTERCEGAMGMSSSRIRQYRSLLQMTDDDDVNDSLWFHADVNDWSEGALRKIVTHVTTSEIKEVISREVWGLDDLRELAKQAEEKKKTEEAAKAEPEPAPAPQRSLIPRVQVTPLQEPPGWWNGRPVSVTRQAAVWRPDAELGRFQISSERVPAGERVSFLECFESGGEAIAKIHRNTTSGEIVHVRLDSLAVGFDAPAPPIPPRSPHLSGSLTVEPEKQTSGQMRFSQVTHETSDMAPGWTRGVKLVTTGLKSLYEQDERGRFVKTAQVPVPVGRVVEVIEWVTQSEEGYNTLLLRVAFPNGRDAYLNGVGGLKLYREDASAHDHPASDKANSLDHDPEDEIQPTIEETVNGLANQHIASSKQEKKIFLQRAETVSLFSSLSRLSQLIDYAAYENINWFFNLTLGEALDLAESGQLQDAFNNTWDVMQRMCQVLMDEHIGPLMVEADQEAQEHVSTED